MINIIPEHQQVDETPVSITLTKHEWALIATAIAGLGDYTVSGKLDPLIGLIFRANDDKMFELYNQIIKVAGGIES